MSISFLLIIALISLYCLLQFFSIYRLYLFRRGVALKQNHEAPGITIITTLKGRADHVLSGLECLRRQSYSGPLELIFVVYDPEDPALRAGRTATSAWPENPHLTIKWITDFALAGANPRSAKMAEGFKHASYSWLYWHAMDSVLDDAHLTTAMNLTGGDPKKFVTSLPVNITPSSLGARLETASLNLEITKFFVLSFAQSGGAAAYGGSMLFHRDLLESSGGLAGTLNRLTDDLILLKQFEQHGGQCILSPHPVLVPQLSLSIREFLKRQVRWMMIARYYMPEVFFAAPLFWLGQALALWGLAFNDPAVLWLGIGLFGFRIFHALAFQMLLRRPTNEWWNVMLLPIYDVLLPICWFLALIVKKLDWAGDTMIIDRYGVLKSGTYKSGLSS